MIKKLQHRFILITMACIGFIFILILLALNISMTASSYNTGYAMLSEYVNRKERLENDSFKDHDFLHKDLSESNTKNESAAEANSTAHTLNSGRGNDWFNDMRIFSIIYNKSGQLTELSTGGNPDLTEEELQAMAATILKNPKEKGKISEYLYLYIQSEDETAIYFLDYAPERTMSAKLLQVCLWIGLAGMLILLVPVIFLSHWVTKPVQLAFDKQKQFIADASHELKTPLTIITTNAEVLESSLPGNKWLSYILEQSGRMKLLINNLLELARLDADNENQPFLPFDLSKAVRSSALSFESMAYEYGKTYTTEIEDNLTACGNEDQIKQLVNILLDNAFKYSGDQGNISLSLSQRGDKKLLIVCNTGSGIEPEDQKHIFERFYRSDVSRSRQSGGYGLGLSIAESIVKVHRGHINVKSDGKSYTEFSVLLP